MQSSSIRRPEQQPLPGGLLGDLWNASPGAFVYALFDTDSEQWPNPDLVKRFKKSARSIRTIQEYAREQAAQIIQVRRHDEPNFTMDVEAAVMEYTSDLDPQRMERFNRIVEEIRTLAEEELIDVMRIKRLVVEQDRIIYGKDRPQFREDLGLSGEG